MDFAKDDLHWHVIAHADYNTYLQRRVVHGALLTSFRYFSPHFKLKVFSLVKQQVDLCALPKLQAIALSSLRITFAVC